LEVKIPQEFLERFESLEREVSTLHRELHSLRESLTSLAVELREAVTELSNPFNVLREPSGSNGGSKGGNGSRGSNGSRGNSRRLQPSTFLSILKVLYGMLEEVSKEQALLLVRGYVDAGVVDAEVGEALVKIVELADSMRRSGLSVEKQLPYLYAILKALNLGGRDLDEYVLKEMLKRERLE